MSSELKVQDRISLKLKQKKLAYGGRVANGESLRDCRMKYFPGVGVRPHTWNKEDRCTKYRLSFSLSQARRKALDSGYAFLRPKVEVHDLLFALARIVVV